MTKTKKRLLDILVISAVVFALLSSLVSPVAAANNNRGTSSNVQLNEVIRLSTKKNSYSFEGGYLGIDVSKWNGTINWSQVAKENPVNFAFVRANYGTDIDPMFVANAKGAHENGLYVGAYHFARFKNRNEMLQEAQAFLNQLKQVTITYPVVLDLEHTTHGLNKASMTPLVVEFLDILAQQGYSTLLYASTNYISKYVDTTALGNHGLWIANYLEQPSTNHKLWQYSNTGKIKGASGFVDLNYCYENLSSRTLRVSKDVSTSIRQLINERYGSSLSLETFDADALHHEINRALQTEVNKQLGGSLDINGYLNASAIEDLSSVPFVLNTTNGRITCLLQSKLFLKGYYTENITGVYDNHTYNAIQSLQTDYGLEVNGTPDYATWATLLDVVEM